jgi:hypothetical protein
VPFVLLAAAAAILAGVVVTAMGRGGELTLFHRDLPAERFRLSSAADVAALRLPTGLFGYQEQATSDVLREIAGLLARQEAESSDCSTRSGGSALGAGSAPASTGSAPMSAVSVSVEPGGTAEQDEAPDQPQPPL